MADLDTLLHELRALGDPVPQSRIFALLRTFTGQRIFFARSSLVRPAQIHLAATMLRSGMPRSEVAIALTERLQVSKATANRIIGRALDERPQGEQQDLFR